MRDCSNDRHDYQGFAPSRASVSTVYTSKVILFFRLIASIQRFHNMNRKSVRDCIIFDEEIDTAGYILFFCEMLLVKLLYMRARGEKILFANTKRGFL